MVYQRLARLGGFFFPATCVLCGEDGAAGRDLCDACAALLPVVDQCCSRCGVPLNAAGLDDGSSVCGRCLQKPPYFDSVLAPYRYEPPLDWLVQRLKFNARLSHGRVLAGLLGDHLQQSCPELPEIIVPVPLHSNRLRERGFNQALELARPLARRFRLPLVTDWLERHADTPQQSTLVAKQRTKNLRRAFSVRKALTAKHVAIVDDVVTTGATVNALAKLMKRNGVATVQVWAVARTPATRDA